MDVLRLLAIIFGTICASGVSLKSTCKLLKNPNSDTPYGIEKESRIFVSILKNILKDDVNCSKSLELVDKNIAVRSTCPWNYTCSNNPNYYPSWYIEAICVSQDCYHKNKSNNCEPVKTKRLFLKHSDDDPNVCEIEFRQVKTGCTCAKKKE